MEIVLQFRIGKTDEMTVRTGQIHGSEEGRVDPGSDEKEGLDVYGNWTMFQEEGIGSNRRLTEVPWDNERSTKLKR